MIQRYWRAYKKRKALKLMEKWRKIVWIIFGFQQLYKIVINKRNLLFDEYIDTSKAKKQTNEEEIKRKDERKNKPIYNA